ncbi:metal-sensitive transcriptional regulator [Corynebacterium bovis]|uniref:metal-sensitive transcriptional regulator n=1 Tax=Corynebacterium bovis TaxID=36808 RepID=UPI003139B645
MTQQQQQEPGDTTPPADAEPQTTGGSADCAGCDADGPQGYGYTGDKKRYLARLRRIEGQVRGIHRMVEEDQYCIDVLTQVAALQSALKGVALALLEDHMQHCVVNAAKAGGEEAEAKLAEASAAIARLVR